jgi:AcrR family transcriptional regulator
MRSTDDATTPRRGRPRSERATQAILDAAASLLFEHGIDGITIERIAATASVSKATIYKWWPSKAAVVVDAFLAQVQPLAPIPDVGDLRRELCEPAAAQLRLFRDTPVGTALKSLLAAAQHDPDVAEAVRTRWLKPRRDLARQAVLRAQERGELRPEVDPEMVLDLVFGPIYYRLLTGHAPLQDDLVERLVDAFLEGLSTPPAARRATRLPKRG